MAKVFIPTLLRPLADGLEFHHIRLSFTGGPLVDVFKNYKHRTLGETLKKKRYEALKQQATAIYANSIAEPPGGFLNALKERGDPFYRRFLNGNAR